MKRLALICGMALGLVACKSIFGCDKKTQVVEADFASPTYDGSLQMVEGLKRQGYTCPFESILNGSGAAIGTKYTCAKCV